MGTKQGAPCGECLRPAPGHFSGCHELFREKAELKDAVDMVSHPPHYTSHPSGVEPITITRHESFCLGNVLKYCLRAKYKGNKIQDLRKAAQYLQWEIERLEAKS